MTELAWQRQKLLQKKYPDVPDIKELVDIINSIGGRNQVRDRALFAMYYLTACRCSEITACHQLRKARYKDKVMIESWKEPHDFIGIRKKDITFEIIDNQECMNIRTENRKNTNRTTKKIPVPISLELPIVNFIKDYLRILYDESILFPFWPSRATQIINKVGWNIHFIRHIRATHLVTKYDFNEQLLIRFMGWSDSRPAKHYMELNSKDIFRQFYKQ